jgi:hypothetical protein
VRSRTTERFRRSFADLPRDVQQQAREAYARFRRDPFHTSLRFKQVHPTEPIFSARVSRDYRAVCIRFREEAADEDTVVWFWIGSHAEYEKVITNQ